MMAMAAFVACEEPTPDTPNKGDDPTPTPGGDDTPSVVVANVFFSASNGEYCYYAAPGQATEVELALVREGNDAADTYTIKVMSASEGLSIPESVSFAAGASEATIKISTPADGKALDTYDFDLKLIGDNVNASASSELGTIRCEGTVYIYEEIVSIGQLDNKDTNNFNYLGYFKQTVWRLAENKFIFKDFMGGGADLAITYGDDNSSGYGYDIISHSYSDPDYQYDYAYTEDGYNLTYLYFWNNDGSENGIYKEFKPKGDQRYITALSLCFGDNYSSYYLTEKSDYIYFTVVDMSIYGESEEIDKSLSWVYYLKFYLNRNADEYDTVTFPEIVVSDYPEAVTNPECPEGSTVIGMYMYYDQIQLDSQVARFVDVDGGMDIIIDNLWQSNIGMTIHTKTGSEAITVEVTNGAGYYDETDNAFYFYGTEWDYFYPWYNDYYACLSSLSIDKYNDDYYNYYSATDKCIYLSVTYQLYLNNAWSDYSSDYLEIYW